MRACLSASCCPHPGQPALGLYRGDGFRNLSSVGPAPVYSHSGTLQSPQTHKPYCAGACFPRDLASVRGNLPQAQHELPGLSYLKGAI